MADIRKASKAAQAMLRQLVDATTEKAAGSSVRVLEVQCWACERWVKPRRMRLPAWVCRDCDAAGVIQTWRRNPGNEPCSPRPVVQPALFDAAGDDGRPR